MKNKLLSVALVAVGVLVLTAPMFAHHGTAVYDNQNSIVLKGTVTKFEFVNPHILIYIKAPDKNGTMQDWTIEMSPPSLATHSGWTKDMMKPGDAIEYKVNPARNGAFVGRGGNAVTINGKALGAGGGA